MAKNNNPINIISPISNLACMIDERRCNIGSIQNYKLDGINPDTGRHLNVKDKNLIIDHFNRICNKNSGKLHQCCNKIIDTSDTTANKVVSGLMNIYKSMRPLTVNGEVKSVELYSKEKKGNGWQKTTPNMICKIYNSTITPDPSDTNLFKAVNLTRDCYTDSCKNDQDEITFSSLVGSDHVKNELEYSFYDDLKVIENIKDGEIEEIKKYIRKYNSVNHKLSHNDYRYRIIHIAAIVGNTDILNMLVALNADLNVTDKYGNTPLHLAAEKGHKLFVLNLMNQGADNTIKNGRGETPIFGAIRNGDMGLVRTMYNNGSDINEVNKEGDNLIHHAIKYSKNKDETTRFLIDYGVDLQMRNKDNKLPIELANLEAKKLKSNNAGKPIQSDDDGNFADKSIPSKPVEGDNMSVEKNHMKTINELEKDIHSMVSYLERASFQQEFGDDVYTSSGNVPVEYGIEMPGQLCTIVGYDDAESCIKAGGQMIDIIEASTVVQVSFLKDTQSSVDNVSNDNLYDQKKGDTQPNEKTPAKIAEHNKQVLIDNYHSQVVKVLDAKTHPTVKQQDVEGFANNITLDMPLTNIVLIILGIAILVMLFNKK